MALDKTLLNQLRVYFVSKDTASNAIKGTIHPRADHGADLGTPTKRFDTIYAREIVAEIGAGGGGSAETSDTVDGFHASSTPKAGYLLALDASSTIPTSVYSEALLSSGTRRLQGNLLVDIGVTVDGVDIDLFKTEFDDHDLQTAFEAHGGDLGVAVLPGNGLVGGGPLDTAAITLSLDTPGELSVDSINSALGNHTHSVVAYSNPGSSSRLLKTDLLGGLTLDNGGLHVDPTNHRVGIGTATPTVRLDVAGAARVSGQITSLVENQPPFVLSSQVLTHNLNADLIDGYHAVDFRQSPNYVEGLRGWHLGGDGTAEFQNVIIRGRIEAAVFSESTISTVSGEVAISQGVKLIAPVAQEDTEITIDTSILSAGDILHFKPAPSKNEWMRVISAPEEVEGGYRYTVTRNLNELATPCTFETGEIGVRKGTAGGLRQPRPLASGEEEGAFGEYMPGGSGSATQGGWLVLNGTIPYFGVEARRGPIWDQIARVVQIGNLVGCPLSKYNTETWGMFVGGETDYIVYDIENGLEIRTFGEGYETNINRDGISAELANFTKVAAPTTFSHEKASIYFDGFDLRVRLEDTNNVQRDYAIGTGTGTGNGGGDATQRSWFGI